MNETTAAPALVHPFEKAQLGKAPFRFIGFYEDRGPKIISTKDGVTVTVGSPGQPMSTCDYCGTSIANVCQIKSADGLEFKVGTDCVAKVDAPLARQTRRAVRDHVAAKRAAKERAARKAELDAQRARNGGQTDAEIEIMARDEAAQQERDEREARLRAEYAAAQPCPTGRVVIEGEIISTKTKEGMYGTEYKMMVKSDAGFKVWGTLPTGFTLDDRGRRVRFTATVEPSADDAKFGFFKRPAKAEYT